MKALLKRDAIVLSDNIRLRCGHKGYIDIEYTPIPYTSAFGIMAIVRCRQCGADWIWGAA